MSDGIPGDDALDQKCENSRAGVNSSVILRTNKECIVNIKPIAWGNEQPPNNECPYNHIKGESPLGEFLITWKGWKECPSYVVEGSPWGWLNSCLDLQDAKDTAKNEYERRILNCLDLLCFGSLK